MLKRYYVMKCVDGSDPDIIRWGIFERIGGGKSRPVAMHANRKLARFEAILHNASNDPALDAPNADDFDRYIAGDR